jgi:hypothetical protein
MGACGKTAKSNTSENRLLARSPTVAKVRAVVERLKRVGILSGTRGDYLIEDPLLVDYLLANGPGSGALKTTVLVRWQPPLAKAFLGASARLV